MTALKHGPLTAELIPLLTPGKSVFLFDDGTLHTFQSTTRFRGSYSVVVCPNRAQTPDRFTYIGERDADGWITCEGGWESNPVPGADVFVRHRCSSPTRGHANNMPWWAHKGEPHDIIAFRLAATPATSQPGISAPAEMDQKTPAVSGGQETSMPMHILFDGPPSHEGPRFIEVENDEGRSINAGEWSERPDGYWQLTVGGRPKMSAAAHEAEQNAILAIVEASASPAQPVSGEPETGRAAAMETRTLAALIAFANAVEGRSRAGRMTLACQHTKALVAALSTQSRGEAVVRARRSITLWMANGMPRPDDASQRACLRRDLEAILAALSQGGSDV